MHSIFGNTDLSVGKKEQRANLIPNAYGLSIQKKRKPQQHPPNSLKKPRPTEPTRHVFVLGFSN